MVGDDTATVGTAGVPSSVVGRTTASIVVDDVEVAVTVGAGTAVAGLVPTVVVVRGIVVEVLVEVLVVDGAHQAGTVVVDPGTEVVESGAELGTVVLDVEHGDVVEVDEVDVVEVDEVDVVEVDGAVVDVLLDVDDVEGATVVLLDGATVVDVVVVATEYAYETHTVADASTMIRFT